MSGIYIHIPYCHSKCYYCDFYSMPLRANHEEFIEALRREYERRRHEITPENPATIYIGGGTPSILPVRSLERILDWLPTDNAKEITIEVNPEDVTEGLAVFLDSSAINRVSMGVQSFDDNVLRKIGRRHTSKEALDSIDRLRNHGIANLSIDLIYGLPGQTIDSWKETLDIAKQIEPEHLSAYSLMLEPGTRLHAMTLTGKISEVAEDDAEEMYRLLCRMSNEMGMTHYEISNFAKPGMESKHNSSYWSLVPYLGLGPGAHSYDGKVRRFNPSNLKKYLETDKPLTETEQLTPQQMIDEYLLIRLRTSEGLSLAEFSGRFGEDETTKLLARAESEIKSGKLRIDRGRMMIEEDNWLVSDPILINLFTDQS